MKRGRVVLVGVAIIVVALVLAWAGTRHGEDAEADAAPVPVLSVTVTRAQELTLPLRVAATGNVAPWQEASVGAETDGLRLVDVRANVGDVVRRGQVLAVFGTDIVEAELAEAVAAVAQAKAEAVEAEVDSQRAKGLDATGAMSSQQVSQYALAAITARARLDAAEAVEQRVRLRLFHARVLAPSNGIITSRSATVGAVVPAGQELFRLIQDSRLEWRAVVSATDLDGLKPGQAVEVTVTGRKPVRGTLRMVAPAIDVDTHSGLVYVDLPRDGPLRAGAFVTGHIEIGERSALTLPQGAVLLRDGFHYVMLVGPKSNVIVRKVTIGRRVGDRIEITKGLAASEAVIASGLGFLGDGDVIRVVDEPHDRDRIEPAVQTTATARSGT